MKNNAVNGYIVPSGDAHLSEYVSACDERRSFISGFDGSSGTAFITLDNAFLWTDGRYFLQASQQLDESCWKLMKEGIDPPFTKWITTKGVCFF